MKTIYVLDSFGQCVRDPHQVILFQNEIAKQICGDKLKKVCHSCAVQTPDLMHDAQRIYSFKNIRIGAEQCDAVHLQEGDRQVILFSSVAHSIQHMRASIDFDLFTKKETKIIELLLNGYSNSEIIRQTKTTRSTLKTHLNHIYQKAPELKNFRKNSRAFH